MVLQKKGRTTWCRMALSLLVVLTYGFGSRVAAGSSPEWPLIELRQYTLHPGSRDVLVKLFEAEFVESQEAVGMKIVGTFRDLERPDRFVWIRAFKDMPSRAEALNSFYSGPVWKAHGRAANATMIDSSNVLLLHAVSAQSALATAGTRPPKGATTESCALIVVTIYSLESAVDAAFVEVFQQAAVPELEAAGIPVIATYVTENAPNNYPQLPIRADRVLVWFARFADVADYHRRTAALRKSQRWRNLADRLHGMGTGTPAVLLLQPTTRSLLASR